MNESLNMYPPISARLIEKLKEDFPDSIPRKEQTPFQYGYLTGIQAVIDKLNFECVRQNEE